MRAPALDLSLRTVPASRVRRVPIGNDAARAAAMASGAGGPGGAPARPARPVG